MKTYNLLSTICGSKLPIAKSKWKYSSSRLRRKEQLLTNLGDVVRIYEEALRQPETDFVAEERVQMMEAATGESAGV